ncbi:MAG: addiction module protein [Spirochaetaceae bacterium]|nr:addiction module protein [Spirochaetaceae bacterium]
MNGRGLDIASMTAEERLSLLDALWDSLAATPEAIPLTEAQCAELDRRLDDLEVEGPVGIPWEDVLSRISSRRR